MNVKNLHNLTLIAGLGFFSGLFAVPAHAQPQPALDLTIRVIEEGEEPSGLINQIELPPPAFFDSDSSDFELSDTVPAEQAVEEARSVVDAAEETVTDNIRESISIDGTVDSTVDSTVDGTTGNVTPDTSVATEVPDQVNDIIDDELPLDGSLQDATDRTTDTVGNIVDNTTDTVGDAVSNTTTPVDDLVDTTSDVVELDGTADLTEDGAIVDNFTEELTTTDTTLEEDLQADSLEVDQVNADLVESADPLQISEDIPADSFEDTVETSEQIDSAVPELIDPAEDTIEDDLIDVNDNLPGI